MSTSLASHAVPMTSGRRVSTRRLRGILLLLVLGLSAVNWTTMPRNVIVPVPHVYDGGGMLCYFGSLAMIVQQQEPRVTYDQVLRRSDLGSLFSEPQDLLSVAAALGYRIHAGGRDGLPGFGKDETPVETRTLRDPEEAMKALEAVLGSGLGALVCIDLEPLEEDRRAHGLPGPFRGGHMIVVRGISDEGVLVHDPQYSAPAGDDLLLRRESFLEAWKKAGYGMIHLEKESTPEPALLNRSLEGLQGSPARLRWLAAFLESTETAPQELLNFIGGNATRRRVLAQWLRESGHERAGRFLEVAAERYAEINPLDRMSHRDVLLNLARLEEQALRELGRQPDTEVGWPEMGVLGPRFFDRSEERLPIRPGVGVGPVLLGRPASAVIPRSWRVGPRGVLRDGGKALPYVVYPDNGLMVATDEEGKIRLVEVRASSHRVSRESTERRRLQIGDLGERVEKALGPGQRSEAGGEDLELLVYQDQGIAFLLRRGMVTGIRVFLPGATVDG